MKAILEFDIPGQEKAVMAFDLPDDRDEFDLARNGAALNAAVWELDGWLRGQIKYQDHVLSADTVKAYQTVRDNLHEFMKDRGLFLE